MRIFQRRLIVLTLLILSNLNLEASDCEKYKKSNIIQGIVSSLAEANQKNISPLRFKAYEELILLTDLENYPNCVILTRHGEIEEHLLISEPLSIPNRSYTFSNQLNPYHINDLALEALIASKEDINQFLIYNTGTRGFDEFSREEGSLRFHFGFLIHEAFHLLAQKHRYTIGLQDWSKDYFSFSYPLLKNDFLIDICYEKNDKVEATREQEDIALRAAYADAYRNNLIGAREFLQEYFNLKEQRYSLLENDQFSHPSWIREVSCAEAEAENKYNEGSAEYVAINYLLGLGFIEPEDIFENSNYISFYSRRGGHRYYYTGMLELLTLNKMDINFEVYTDKSFQEDNLVWEDLPYGRIQSFINHQINE